LFGLASSKACFFGNSGNNLAFNGVHNRV
jgi:hypothetical protein